MYHSTLSARPGHTSKTLLNQIGHTEPAAQAKHRGGIDTSYYHIMEQSPGESGIGKKFHMRVCLRRHLYTTLLHKPGRATPQGHFSTRSDIQSQPPRQSIEGVQTHHILEQSLGESGIGTLIMKFVYICDHCIYTLLYVYIPRRYRSISNDILSICRNSLFY